MIEAIEVGRYRFNKIGREKVTKEADIRCPQDILRSVRPHLMSREIDWTFDPSSNEGNIICGFHLVGTFERIGEISNGNSAEQTG